MRSSSKLNVVRKLAVLAAVAGPLTSAMATNGMLMEGYGPISTGMGGASQAINHGTASMAQNPATLGMISEGGTLDLAAGVLGPKVTSSMPGMDAPSGGTSYLMPAFGYARRSGKLSYGLGMFAQGGMGTEYEGASFMSAGTGLPSRSELGIGNLLAPLAYQVTPDLTIGATVKFMWSSLDVQMNGRLTDLAGMMTGGQGGLATNMGMMAQGQVPGVNPNTTIARIDFSDSSKFSGAAKSTGFGASLGATFKASKELMLGASYQFKSALADMKTGSSSANLGIVGMLNDSGQMSVIDFQMPAVLAVGVSWQASPAVLLAADVKSIGWADAMKSFKMRYDSASPGMGFVTFAIDQQWKDQTVLNLGMAWKASNELTVRAGVNLADNPVPDTYVNPLFPATVKNHATLGFGYKVSTQSDFNASVTMAPASNVTSGSGVAISHAQTNVQLMFTQRF